MSDPAELGFQWSIEEFSKDNLNIKLNFDNPDLISINPEPEELIVQIKDLHD